MGALFGSPREPVIPKAPAAPAPTPLNDIGAKVVTGTDALARLNERASGKKVQEALKKTTKASRGVAGLGGAGKGAEQKKQKTGVNAGNYI